MHRNFRTLALAGALALPIAGGAAWAQTAQPSATPAPTAGTVQTAPGGDATTKSEKPSLGHEKSATANGAVTDKTTGDKTTGNKTDAGKAAADTKAHGTAKHRTDKSAHSGAAGTLHKDQTAAAPDAAKKPAQPGTAPSSDAAKKL